MRFDCKIPDILYQTLWTFFLLFFKIVRPYKQNLLECIFTCRSKITDVLSPLWALYLSFLRSFEHTNKNLLLLPQLKKNHTRLRETIRLTQNVAITIKSELHIHTYIYKRLKCYLSSLLVLMHFLVTAKYLKYCLHPTWEFFLIFFKIVRAYKEKLTFISFFFFFF